MIEDTMPSGQMLYWDRDPIVTPVKMSESIYTVKMSESIYKVHIQINSDSLYSAKLRFKYSAKMTNCSSRMIFLVIIWSQNNY